MRTYQPSIFVLTLTLTALAALTSAHDHVKQHSHFCPGAGHSLFCADNQTLVILKAWYGRVAHDHASCIPEGANATQPDLSKDCGSSLMESKSSWCKQNWENRGCNIEVKNLEPKVEDVKCPQSVVKYFYLEYECVGSTAATVAPSSSRGGVLGLLAFSLVSLFVMSV
ncbi:hypothetical protein ACOMHN_015388 [Nucella lapillus]